MNFFDSAMYVLGFITFVIFITALVVNFGIAIFEWLDQRKKNKTQV